MLLQHHSGTPIKEQGALKEQNAEFSLQQTALQRVQFVDVLRAFALFGILFIHSIDEFLASSFAGHLEFSPTDRLFARSLRVLIHDKFYVIFSFLFGWGFYIMYRSASRRNKPFVKRYLWRLTILLAIGTLHSLLYWDILQIYAVIAPSLLLCRNLGNRQLLTITLLLFLASTASFVFREHLWQLLSDLKDNGAPIPGKVVQYIVTGRGFMTAAMFVLGLYAGRMCVFENLSHKLPLFKRLALGSGGVALLTVPLFYLNDPAAETGVSTIESIGHSLQTIALACFYVSALTLLYCRTRLRGMLDSLSPLGKVSLTGYLMQSVFIQLFYSFGYGQAMGLMGALAITFLFYLGQVLFARLWLYWFNMGPIEWLWRLLTYLEWKSPIKKKASLG